MWMVRVVMAKTKYLRFVGVGSDRAASGNAFIPWLFVSPIFVEEGIDRCSQNYEHPQHESVNVARTTRLIAQTWLCAQTVETTACRTGLAQVAAMYALVFK